MARFPTLTPVAVYGTLKEGEENHGRFLHGKAPVFRGACKLPYRMYANEDYPILVPHPELCPVAVEVFEVDAKELEALDALETPYGYHRETVALEPFGREVAVYVHPGPAPPDFSVVPSGVWRSASSPPSASGSESEFELDSEGE